MAELMLMEDVAATTDIPINTLRYWRAQGIGPPSARIGRRVYYRRAEIESWINSQFDEPASA